MFNVKDQTFVIFNKENVAYTDVGMFIISLITKVHMPVFSS
jgi:hypothetical protein